VIYLVEINFRYFALKKLPRNLKLLNFVRMMWDERNVTKDARFYAIKIPFEYDIHIYLAYAINLKAVYKVLLA
jgi:hypothetical protein